MGLSKNINAFTHVQPVLNAALKHNAITYTLPDIKAAFRWRLEAYHYRKLLAASGPTPYDRLVMRVVKNQVLIRTQHLTGVITVNDEVQPIAIDTEIHDPLLEYVEHLALEIDEETK
jgi:hypothetical protein